MRGTRRSVSERVARARRVVARDLRTDPLLPAILLLAALLGSFWFWHRLPNFATRDEQARLFDPMVAFGSVLADPNLESVREGVAWGRVPFGATFYVFGLALLPAILAALLLGELDAFLAFQFPPGPAYGYWEVWRETPAWIWTISLSLVRLFSVAFAVGSVYLTYRLGVELRDRATGRLAALFLAVTFGLLTLAHEGGEDVPALFFTLLALNFLVVYVRSGEAAPFLAASASGGFALAFKLTAAPVVLLVALAFLLRVHRAGPAWREELLRPGLLLGGATAGLLALLLGFPTLLVGDVDFFLGRVFGHSFSRASHPTGPDAPVWWWFAKQYLNAFGLPLFLGALAGVVATFVQVGDRRRDAHVAVLVFAAIAAYVVMFAGWHDFRTHHLLPTLPLLVLLLAAALVRFEERSPGAARVLMAILLVSGGTYATVGVLGYAAAPRDDAEAWLATHAEPNDTVEVYRIHVQDTAVPHGMDVQHHFRVEDAEIEPCPEWIMLGYRDLLYLKDGTYVRNSERRKAYVRSLLSGEAGYAVAAEFGPRPPNYVPDRPTPGSLMDLIEVGIYPGTDQYADEQELTENQYTVILKRTDACDPSRSVPY